MPPVAAAAAAGLVSAGLAGAGLITVGAGAVAFFGSAALAAGIITFGTTLVLGLATSALSPKPKAGSLDFNAGSRTVSLRQPTAPWRVVYGMTRVGGIFAFMGTRGEGNKSLDCVVVLAGHECSGIGDIYFDDTAVTIDPSTGFATDKYAGTGKDVLIIRHLGEPDQEADAWMLQLHPDEWTADHRLRGRAYIFVGLFFNPNIFPNGLPNITAIVAGRKVYDPRDANQSLSDPSTWVWSTNPALCKADYITNKAFGLGADWSELDEPTLIAAANVCDEEVEKADGTTEKRYTCNGSFTTDATPKDILESLNTADCGSVVYVGGKWRFYSGAYRAPTIPLDEDDLRGPITVQPLVSRRENFNAVKGTFVSPDNFYQPTDFPAVKSDVFMAQDNGERVYKDITLAWTNSASMAQRIAKIILLRARQQITTVWPCKLGAYQCQVPDVVNLNNTRFGWSDKPFEVAESTLTIEQDDQGNPYLGVNLTLRETDPSVYDWSTSEEQAVDPAPNTNLPDPFSVPAPGVPTISESLYETKEGAGIKVKVTVSWAVSDDGFVRRYQLEWKPIAETTYRVLPQTPDTAYDLFDVAPGIYDFRVKAINDLGVSSAYASVRKEVIGLGVPPADVTGLSITAVSSLAFLQWDRHPDPDVRRGGYLRFRHSDDTVAPTWDAAIDIGPSVDGNATQTVLPLVAGSYLVKAVDSSGNFSINAAFVTTNAPSLLPFTNLATITESPTFGGTKTNCVVDTGKLTLTGNSLFDDITDLDAVVDLDIEGGIAGSGSYLFASGTDLGSAGTVRIKAAVTATVVNTLDQIDSRGANVDDWENFDGNVASSAGVKLYIRQTDDDPAVSPTWGPWQRLTIGDYRARGFEYKAELFTEDPAYNVEISSLSVMIDQAA